MDPIVIKAEPATLQARSAAMGAASRSDHLLVVGQDETRGAVEYHGAFSCGGWSASHHTDKAALEATHARHAAKKRGAANG